MDYFLFGYSNRSKTFRVHKLKYVRGNDKSEQVSSVRGNPQNSTIILVYIPPITPHINPLLNMVIKLSPSSVCTLSQLFALFVVGLMFGVNG